MARFSKRAKLYWAFSALFILLGVFFISFSVGGAVLLFVLALVYFFSGIKIRDPQKFAEFQKQRQSKTSIRKAYHKNGLVTPPETFNDYKLIKRYDNVRLFTPDKIKENPSPAYVGETARLELEPENDYDDKAVVVYFRGIKVGYLYDYFREHCYKHLKSGLPIVSVFQSYKWRGDDLDLYVFLGLYGEDG